MRSTGEKVILGLCAVVLAIFLLPVVLGVFGFGHHWEVRTVSREKTIQNNLRQIASAADQYMIESGATVAGVADIIGTDRYIKALPGSVAGERYDGLFPLREGFTLLEVSKADGETVRYTQ